MKHISDQIKEILSANEQHGFTDTSIESLSQQISVYHEELIFQNDELKKTNERLEAINLRFKTLFERAPVPYLITDYEGNCLEWNPLFYKLFHAVQMDKPLSSMVDPTSQDKFYFFIRAIRNRDMETNPHSCLLRFSASKENIYQKVHVNGMNINDKKCLLWTFVNMTAEMHHLNQIEHLTYKDQLTKFYNRRFFHEELQRLDVSRNLPLALIVADVNGLKLINDAFGHKKGDALLLLVADTLRGICREDEILARIGGDEFIILLPKIQEQDLVNLYLRLKEGCGQITIEDIETSVSFGYSMKVKSSQLIKDVQKEAEDMMYHQKLFMHSSQHKKVVDGILSTLHEKYPREEDHSSRVSNYMEAMGHAMKLHESEIIQLKSMGLLHDIGKIAIDYSILEKSQPLTEQEFSEIRKHPEIGYRILKSAGSFQNIMDGVLLHHERLDGTGYPKGLKAKDIPMESKLLAICDAYDAMTSDRPYRKAYSKKVALEELIRCSGHSFDTKLVTIFCDMVNKEGV